MIQTIFPFCNDCELNDELCCLCTDCKCKNGEHYKPKTSKPKVILIMAMTADGIIAKNNNHFTDWTGREDKKYFQDVTTEAGAVIMGRNTFETIGAPLKNRYNVVMTSKAPILISKYDNLIFSNMSAVVLLHMLKMKQYKSVCVIGGSHVNTTFMYNNLIDEIHIVIAPKLFGSGLTMFSKTVTFDIDLELKLARAFNDDHMLIVYGVKRKSK